jgi:hypothetical protein
MNLNHARLPIPPYPHNFESPVAWQTTGRTAQAIYHYLFRWMHLKSTGK